MDELQREIERLSQENQELRDLLQQATERLTAAEETIKQLREQLGRNSRNRFKIWQYVLIVVFISVIVWIWVYGPTDSDIFNELFYPSIVGGSIGAFTAVRVRIKLWHYVLIAVFLNVIVWIWVVFGDINPGGYDYSINVPSTSQIVAAIVGGSIGVFAVVFLVSRIAAFLDSKENKAVHLTSVIFCTSIDAFLFASVFYTIVNIACPRC